MINQWDTTESKKELLKRTWTPNPLTLPSKVVPKGLSSERQWYLFEKIRPFCPLDDQDLTCPEPTIPKIASRASTPSIVDEGEVFSPRTTHGPEMDCRFVGLQTLVV